MGIIEAMDLMHSKKIGIVLMDWMLTYSDGVNICQSIKSMKIVILSVWEDEKLEAIAL